MSKESVKKVSQLVGAGERERLSPNVWALVVKFVEYVFKLAARWGFRLGLFAKGITF